MWADAVIIGESTFPSGNYIPSSCSSLSPFIFEYQKSTSRLEFTGREKCFTAPSSMYK